jgi:hypothetical protein
MTTCLLSRYGLLWGFTLVFCKSWHNGVHNYLNTCLYVLWSTLILILKQSISLFSQFVFDEFIAKGGEYGHKVNKILANRVHARRNMINDYLRERACIESVRGSVDFELFLLFSWICRFSCRLLAFAIFLLLDDLFELFVDFWSSSCASRGLGFELQIVCLLLLMDSSRGRLRNQVVSSLVWLWWVIDMARFEFESGTVQLFCLYPLFNWRIMFACLVVCRWQVRHGVQQRGLW